MLIADHKRLDAPPGAYSWKFIEDSVRNGIIQIKDKYRIGPDPDLPRPVGAKHGAKTTRTPFTKDDDANLAKWVLSRRSQQQQGNAIYQEYEAIVSANLQSMNVANSCRTLDIHGNHGATGLSRGFNHAGWQHWKGWQLRRQRPM